MVDFLLAVADSHMQSLDGGNPDFMAENSPFYEWNSMTIKELEHMSVLNVLCHVM